MIRRLAVAAALLGAAMFAAVPAHHTSTVGAYSQCAANTECGWLYYSDPQHTNLVGEHTTNCQGVVLDWGIKQGYSVFISQGCGIVES